MVFATTVPSTSSPISDAVLPVLNDSLKRNLMDNTHIYYGNTPNLSLYCRNTWHFWDKNGIMAPMNTYVVGSQVAQARSLRSALSPAGGTTTSRSSL